MVNKLKTEFIYEYSMGYCIAPGDFNLPFINSMSQGVIFTPKK